MASKGQKFNRYSDNNMKKEIVDKYLSGVSSTFLSEEYDIPKGTIKTWVSKLRKTGSLDNDIYHKRGRSKEAELTKDDYKERYEILKKYQAFLKAQRERK